MGLEDIQRQAYEAIQRIRGADPAEGPPEPRARAAWLLETNGGRRHPLDVVAGGSVAPALKARGFVRYGRTWNRRVDRAVHVINLQSSKYNTLMLGSAVIFYVNVAVCVPELYELVFNQPVREPVREYDGQLRQRLNRL